MEAKYSRISVQRGVDITFVTLNDKEILDEHSISSLEKEVLDVMENADHPDMLLDFSHVRFMSSAFLGLLVKLHKHICEKGGELKLTNVSESIYRVFEITRLNKVIQINNE